MAEVKLLGSWPSPYSYRVEWGLKLKGVKYEYIEENLSNKSPLLLEYNPVHKKIPVLLHGGKAIAESLVILEYIEETWANEPLLLPQDPYQRATARFWAKFGEEKLKAIWEVVRSEGSEQEKHVQESLEALRSLEEHGLGEKKFFGGETIGFADISLGWMCHWLGVIEEIVGIKMVEPHSFPRLHAWIETIAQVPVIKENLPSHHENVAFSLRWRHKLLASQDPYS